MEMPRVETVLRIGRDARIAHVAMVFVVMFSSSPASAQATAPPAFVLLGPEGAVARVITTDAQCPQITIDGNARAMQVRAAPDREFAVTVCDAAIPMGTRSATVGDQTLKLPTPDPARIVVIGDTGCRLNGDRAQSCSDPQQWPLVRTAASGARFEPDLVIHLGDYHYREVPCRADQAACDDGPFGDNWETWNAELFTPAADLLRAAPWIIVRGNHEDCTRAGAGYFRLVDPRPLSAHCVRYTTPYSIDYMNPQLIVMDNSAVNDHEIEPEQLAAYTLQLKQIDRLARGNAWLLMHDPIYVFGHLGIRDGKEELFIDQLTLQRASSNRFSPAIQMFLGGHIHLFEALSFDGERPPSLVVGNSGAELDPPITTPLAGLEIGGLKVASGTSISRFGYAAMESSGKAWVVSVRDPSGGEIERCALDSGRLLCGPAAAPDRWPALAIVAAVIALVGLALRLRLAMQRVSP
jgi:Calcineurin-like phosphoesterase